MGASRQESEPIGSTVPLAPASDFYAYHLRVGSLSFAALRSVSPLKSQFVQPANVVSIRVPRRIQNYEVAKRISSQIFNIVLRRAKISQGFISSDLFR